MKIESRHVRLGAVVMVLFVGSASAEPEGVPSQALARVDKPAVTSAVIVSTAAVASEPAASQSGTDSRTIPERLDASAVQRKVTAHKTQLAECARALHAQAPALTGQVMMRWTILPYGETDEIVAADATGEIAPLVDCLRDVIDGWYFPQHGVAQRVEFEFKY